MSSDEGNWVDYRWLTVVGGFASSGVAWCIGAQSLTECMSRTLSCKTLLLWQACLVSEVAFSFMIARVLYLIGALALQLAVCMEFAGAMAIGSRLTKVIAENFIKPEAFAREPELYAYAMLCSLASASLWITCASFLRLPVSTAQAIVGALFGAGLVFDGRKSVVWDEHRDSFAYSAGFVPAVVSWIFSPAVALAVAWILCFVNHQVVLRHANKQRRALYLLPPIVTGTVFVFVFLCMVPGLQHSNTVSAWVAAAVAGCCGLLSAVPGIWLLQLLITQQQARQSRLQKSATGDQLVSFVGWQHSPERTTPTPALNLAMDPMQGIANFAMQDITQDIAKDMEEDNASEPVPISNLRSSAEQATAAAEVVYQYLQLLTASILAFLHGGKNVGYAIGPFAAILYVYENLQTTTDVPVARWYLALGSVGLSLGICMFGYNVMRNLNPNLTKLAPSQGFCCDVAVAAVVAVAVYYGLPISTSHCLVAAEIGVGLAEKRRLAVKWKLLLRLAVASALTLACCGLVSAAIFAQGAYAPSIPATTEINNYKMTLMMLTTNIWASLNRSNYNTAAPVGRFDVGLNQTIVNESLALLSISRSSDNTSLVAHIFPDQLFTFMQDALSLLHNHSIRTIGFNASAWNVTTDRLVLPAAT